MCLVRTLIYIVVISVSQCKVSEVRSAYLKLEESGATGDEQTPNPSTV